MTLLTYHIAYSNLFSTQSEHPRTSIYQYHPSVQKAFLLNVYISGLQSANLKGGQDKPV